MITDTLTPSDLAEAGAGQADDTADAIMERLGGDDAPAAEDDTADAPAAEGEGEQPAADATAQQQQPEPEPTFQQASAVATQIMQALASDGDVRAVLDPAYAAKLAEEDPLGLVQAQGRGARKLQEAQPYLAAAQQHGQAAQAREQAKLAEFAPELVGDTKEAKAARAEVRAFLKGEGFSEAEINGIADHRVLRTVMKSFRAAKALEAMRPDRAPSPTVRPGSRNASRAEKVARAVERTTDLRAQADLIASIL